MNSQLKIEQLASLSGCILPENLPVEKWVRIPENSGKSPEQIKQIRKEQAQRKAIEAESYLKEVVQSAGNAEALFAIRSGNVPESEMVIVGDIDFKNPLNVGKDEAIAPARLVKASYSIPEFSGEENDSVWSDPFLLDMAGGKSC